MELSPELIKLMNEASESMGAEIRNSLGLTDDWVYRDVRWFNEEYWNKFLATLGEGNYIILIASNKMFNDGTRGFGGQFMISERGLQNLRDYSESRVISVDDLLPPEIDHDMLDYN